MRISKLSKGKAVFMTVLGVLAAAMLILSLTFGTGAASTPYSAENAVSTTTQRGLGEYYGDMSTVADEFASEYIVTRHHSLGASHYAYTEGVSDEFPEIAGAPNGSESVFNGGSQLVRLTVTPGSDGATTRENLLIDDPEGVVRDPDVSEDGTKVLFSWKKSKYDDDFHIYMYDLNKEGEDDAITQLTYGQGVADIEPRFLPNGKILFSSTRDVQKVDCWITPVSNLYTCDINGENMIRLGYDQVHTTYPTVTGDGRVLYTRWDYNDRNQMFIQAAFQMFPDGTGQTEVFGNNCSFPTTLMHTREIPGISSKYVTVVSGHHTYQGGKLAILDLSKGRNSKDAVDFVFESINKDDYVDLQGQQGAIYKYPYALNENEFLVARADSWADNKANTRFDLLYMNSKTGKQEVLLDRDTGAYSPSQIAPIIHRSVFERPSVVNYGKDTGTYYIGDVYQGDPMKGVERGTAKYLRVVGLEFRSYAVGELHADGGQVGGSSDPHTPAGASLTSWDLKKVLGIVPIEEDGSVLFSVPSEVPVYFQILNENGEMIQSMRSWSTLMPGETFSCVGCHENKNSVPPLSATVTDAMRKGVQELQPDLYMRDREDTMDYMDYDPYEDYKGFSYAKEVQTVLNNCTTCHNNQSAAMNMIGGGISAEGATNVLAKDANWKYTVAADAPSGWNAAEFNDSGWSSGRAPFGNTPDGQSNTDWSGLNSIFTRTTFEVTEAQLSQAMILTWQYDENPHVYINGVEVATASGYITGPKSTRVMVPAGVLHAGTNTIAATAVNSTGGQYLSVAVGFKDMSGTSDPNPVSLEGTFVKGEREKMNYNLSYLVLTGSTLTGNYYLANPSNAYTNWISSMSQAEILQPNQYGSSKSGVIKMLRNELDTTHYGLLTDAQIAAIATWIDLGCPSRGTYDENNTWGARDYQEYEELTNMRAFYDTADRQAKNQVAGLADTREFTIEYLRNGIVLKSVTQSGLVQLFPGTKYQAGDKVRVTLPDGQEYFYFTMNARTKYSMIYAAGGVFEFDVPVYAGSVFPKSFMNYSDPTIAAYLPTEEQIYAEEYNLAMNPYANDFANVYPKVAANSEWNNNTSDHVNHPDNIDGPFLARNAIDGFTNNQGHVGYPTTSWGPNKDQKDIWFEIDFGREVTVNKLVLYIRADFPHDTYFDSVDVQLSDGTMKTVSVYGTKEAQQFNLGGITTTSIKLLNFHSKESNWAGLTEVEVYGTNN